MLHKLHIFLTFILCILPISETFFHVFSEHIAQITHSTPLFPDFRRIKLKKQQRSRSDSRIARIPYSQQKARRILPAGFCRICFLGDSSVTLYLFGCKVPIHRSQFPLHYRTLPLRNNWQRDSLGMPYESIIHNIQDLLSYAEDHFSISGHHCNR